MQNPKRSSQFQESNVSKSASVKACTSVSSVTQSESRDPSTQIKRNYRRFCIEGDTMSKVIPYWRWYHIEGDTILKVITPPASSSIVNQWMWTIVLGYADVSTSSDKYSTTNATTLTLFERWSASPSGWQALSKRCARKDYSDIAEVLYITNQPQSSVQRLVYWSGPNDLKTSAQGTSHRCLKWS
jgi:hypothetical protein